MRDMSSACEKIGGDYSPYSSDTAVVRSNGLDRSDLCVHEYLADIFCFIERRHASMPLRHDTMTTLGSRGGYCGSFLEPSEWE